MIGKICQFGHPSDSFELNSGAGFVISHLDHATVQQLKQKPWRLRAFAGKNQARFFRTKETAVDINSKPTPSIRINNSADVRYGRRANQRSVSESAV